MNALVTINNGEARTTTLAIAEGVEQDHASVIKLVRNYQSDLEDFGPIGFEIQKGQPLPQGGFAKSTEYALLNEHQATTIITFMRNIGPVKEFKKRLVKAFYELARGVDTMSPELQLAHAVLTAAKMIEDQKLLISEMKPKAEFYDAVTGSSTAIGMDAVAKVLNMGIGRNNLFEFLRTHEILREDNTPYQRYVDAGYFRLIESKFSKPDGSSHISLKTVVYQKGVEYIRKQLKEAGYGGVA